MAKGKGGKDKKKKKEPKVKMIGNETLGQIVRRLLKSYEKNCAEMGTTPSDKLLTQMKLCVENERLLENIILTWNNKMAVGEPPITLEPVLLFLRQERYSYLKDLRVWNTPVDHVNAASLALLLEKAFIPLRRIEIMDCLLSESAVTRLSLSFPFCQNLTHLYFDYNEFGDEGCKGLCYGLKGTNSLLSLSLNYCGLGVPCGKMLGHLLATTTIREMFLDGNDLECEGALALICQCSVAAEIEVMEKQNEEKLKAEAKEENARLEKENKYNRSMVSEMDTLSTDGNKTAEEFITVPIDQNDDKKKKKGKKKKGKTPPPPPTPGPLIVKLHMADNGIDGMKGQSVITAKNSKEKPNEDPEQSEGSGKMKSENAEPVIDQLTLFVQEICRLITYSESLEELDLDDNLIGDLGAIRILGALEKREEFGLPGVKVRTTHRMNPDTFNEIMKLASGLKKKKKKKGKKKK